MKAILFVVFIGSTTLAQAPATRLKPVHNIVLTDGHDISDAAEVSSAIDILSKDTQSCRSAASKERQACGCSFTRDLKKLKAAYAAVVAKHPGWSNENAVVSYRNTVNENSVSLNFPAIKRQLDACAQFKQ